jgi:hypothetical protein
MGTAVSVPPAPATGDTTAVAPPPDAEAIAQALYGPAEAPPTPPVAAPPADADDRPLRYGDGTTVNPENVAETQTFRRFVAEKQMPPASRSALQAYYRP